MKHNNTRIELNRSVNGAGRPGRLNTAGRLGTVALLLLGCGACRPFDPLHRTVAESRLMGDPNYSISPDIKVPRTLALYGCGAQAMAAAMAYCDSSRTVDEVYHSLPNRGKPTPSFAVLLIARSLGYKAKLARGNLELLQENIRNRIPTLVLFDRAPFNLSSTDLVNMRHWSVVSGMRTDKSQILLAAPGREHHVVEQEEFARRWATTANCMISIRSPKPGKRGKGTS